MIAGELDISIGSMIPAGAMTVAIVSGHFGAPIIVGMAASLALGVLVGLINGILVVRTAVPSLIVTLGTLFAVQGLVLGLSVLLTGTTSVALYAPGWAKFLFGSFIGGSLPGDDLLVDRDRGGLRLRHAPQPLRQLGLRHGRRQGQRPQRRHPDRQGDDHPLRRSPSTSAAFVGMCQTILYNSAQVSGGMSFIFNAIIAVVVGGVLLTGGFGSVIGIVFGTLTFSIVNQGIYFTDFDAQLVEPDHRHPAAARRADEQHLPQDGALLQPEEGEEVMATPILELRNVNKSFGPIDVLHDISLKVHAGEVLCLLGDNGAGKSTLIKTLSGVHKPTSGTVLMDGKEVDFASPREASDMGIATVHQFGGTFPLMSVGRCFFVGREPTKKWGPLKVYDRAKANEIAVKAIQSFGITRIDDGDRLVGGMSGGERQSLAIARAVHFGARVLILDEPTAALGVKQASHVLRIVLEAQQARAGGDLHHPPGHPRDGRRRPLRRADPGRRGGQLPQGREDPRGAHRPDGRRRGPGRPRQPRSKATWRPTRAIRRRSALQPERASSRPRPTGAGPASPDRRRFQTTRHTLPRQRGASR